FLCHDLSASTQLLGSAQNRGTHAARSEALASLAVRQTAGLTSGHAEREPLPGRRPDGSATAISESLVRSARAAPPLPIATTARAPLRAAPSADPAPSVPTSIAPVPGPLPIGPSLNRNFLLCSIRNF